MQVKEGNLEAKAVLTAPLSLEGDESDSNYRTPNIIQRILSLLRSVKPGSDLTRIQASFSNLIYVLQWSF